MGDEIESVDRRNERSLLLKQPRPLLDSKRHLIVLWSAKSACTAVYVWFSSVCGFLDEVRREYDFPHKHRSAVYMRSRAYRECLESDLSDFHVVKVIRDPYTRAVSSFRQALVRGYIDDEVSSRGLDFTKGVSFRQFLSVLACLDLTAANIHCRVQLHPFESLRKPDTVINISKRDLFTELNALEKRMGWPVTDFTGMDWFHDLELSRQLPMHPSDQENMFAEPLVRARPLLATPFPPQERLLTRSARRKIEAVYDIDFNAYRDYL